MWDAKPGDKVICILDYPPLHNLIYPIKGNIYTLREVGVAYGGEVDGFLPACRLQEIINTEVIVRKGSGIEEMGEIWFRNSAFRPVNKNYSIFEELLKHPLPLRTSRIKETV